LGWLVQDEYIYPNSVAFVAPSKPVVLKETLRKDISKLEKELDKAKDTIHKLRSRLNEKSSKKSKVDGGDGKTIEVLADEKANEMYNTRRTDDEGTYKEQIRNLKECYARQTEKIEKLEKDLTAEQSKCAGLEKDAQYNSDLHKLEVSNLDQRLKGAEKDKGAFQRLLLPRITSTAPSRRGDIASMNYVSPEFSRDENGQKRGNLRGTDESP